MDSLLHDVRFAVRALLRRPGFTAAVLLTLALGIGANSAIFSVVNDLLLRPLPYPDADRLVVVWGHQAQIGNEGASQPDFNDWRAQNTTFAQMGAFANTSFNLTAEGAEPERVVGGIVSANFFRTLGVAPARGRDFLPAEEQPGAPKVAIVSYGYWQRRFGGRPGLVGESLMLNGAPYTVVGILPKGVEPRPDVDLWAPLPINQSQGRRADFLLVVGRMKSGVTLTRAQAEMSTIARRLEAQYPNSNAGWGIQLVPMHEQLVGGVRTALLLFMGAVALVLLIACANVANLMLARATGREREMAVRAALGANRGRLLQQVLTESLVVAVVGGALGLALGAWGVSALRAMSPDLLPKLRAGGGGLDVRVVAFTALLAAVTGVLFGLAPALHLARGTLRGGMGTRGAVSGSGVRSLRGALVLAEVALAMVLLVGAGLLIRSFDRLTRVDPGFDPRGVFTAHVALPRTKYAEPQRMRAFFEQLRGDLAARPGVTSAALVSDLPMSGSNYWAFAIAGRAAPAPDVVQDAQAFTATPEYFKTMRIPLLQGRVLDPRDDDRAPAVAVINREMAHRYWPGTSPLGARITFGNPTDTSSVWMTVVGVVGDTRQEGLDAKPYPQVYRAFAQSPQRSMMLAVRTAGDASALTAPARQAVRALDADLPLFDVQPMQERVAKSVTRPRVSMALLGAFAAAALVLAALGIYGVVSYSVARRTQEIGVRLALGARPAQLLRMLVQQGIAPAVAGVALGLAGALAATRLMGSLLYGVSATDAATFAAVALFLLAVALVACWIPARRATRVDPTVALRAE